MSEKRRRARIQGGGWAASSSKSKEKPATRDEHKPLESYTFKPTVEVYIFSFHT